MKHLLGGVALAALIVAGPPAWARSPANPTAGMVIIPPANPAAAKPADAAPSTRPVAAEPAPAKPAAPPVAAKAEPSAATPVIATAIRHDRPVSHRYVMHRRHIRHGHRWRDGGSERVAEALNRDELHRMTAAGTAPR